MVAAALQTGYVRGHKVATKEALRKARTATRIQRHMTIEVVTELFGPNAAVLFVKRMDMREKMVGSEIIGNMADIFEKLGLDPADVGKLRKVFEEQTSDGKITGFELPIDPEEHTSPGTGEEMEGLEVPEGATGELTLHPDGTSDARIVLDPNDEEVAVP
jgi:hypothetical protein